MSSIVDFRPRIPAASTKPKHNDAPATIIIFPGVRYERQVSAETIEKWSAAAWIAKFQAHPVLTI